MDRRPTWIDCDEAGDYVVPNVLSPRDLVFRPDNMDETVPHTLCVLPYRYHRRQVFPRWVSYILKINIIEIPIPGENNSKSPRHWSFD